LYDNHIKFFNTKPTTTIVWKKAKKS